MLTNKNGDVAGTQKQFFLIISSQYVSAQVGHHQVILEEIHKW
jgi:hypothetical protein